jgi:hypothetical protein
MTRAFISASLERETMATEGWPRRLKKRHHEMLAVPARHDDRRLFVDDAVGKRLVVMDQTVRLVDEAQISVQRHDQQIGDKTRFGERCADLAPQTLFPANTLMPSRADRDLVVHLAFAGCRVSAARHPVCCLMRRGIATPVGAASSRKPFYVSFSGSSKRCRCTT